MKKLFCNFKFWLVLTLAVIVAGMTLFGIFGFAGAVDYKEHYEVSVSVDQDVQNAFSEAKKASEEYFNKKGASLVSYSTQEVETENTILFKFNEDVSALAGELKAYIESKLTSADREVTVSVKLANDAGAKQVVSVITALVIVAVAITVLLIILDKVATAFSVLFSGVLSLIVYVSLLNIFRLPAMPFLGITIFGAFILGVAFSYLAISKFNEILSLSGNEKLTFTEVAKLGIEASTLKFAVVGLSALVLGILFLAIGGGYLAILGLQVIAITISVLLACYVWTPYIWPALKGLKK